MAKYKIYFQLLISITLVNVVIAVLGSFLATNYQGFSPYLEGLLRNGLINAGISYVILVLVVRFLDNKKGIRNFLIGFIHFVNLLILYEFIVGLIIKVNAK